MKSKAKGKRTKSKGFVSDGSATPNTNTPSVSGAFMELAEQGKLQRVMDLMAEYSNLSAGLSEVEAALKECHNPIWLKDYSKRVRRQGRSFQKDLPRHTKQLERRKAQIVARRDRVLTKLQEIDVPAPEGTFTTLAIPPDKQAFSQTLQNLPIGSNANAPKRFRDQLIRELAHLSDEEICRRLDALLMLHDSPPIGFPDDWPEKHKVSKYLDAYASKSCKNLVQKLISKAKAGF
jgi:hypothetical protein